ncbi:MAG: hypothetical protein ACJ79K_10335 [Gemmatimonadaceae bacterium]
MHELPLIAVLKSVRRAGLGAFLLAGPSLAAAQSARAYEPLYGVRFGSAQHQSVYAGIAHLSRITADEQTGTTLELEAGRSAGQVGVGVIGIAPKAVEVRLQLVGLRTYGRATDIAPGQNYVGVEAQIGAILGVSIGYYRRIHGSAPGDASFRGIRFVIGV